MGDYFQHIIRAGSNPLAYTHSYNDDKNGNFQQKFFFISKQFIKRTLGYRKRTCYIVHVDSLNPKVIKDFQRLFPPHATLTLHGRFPFFAPAIIYINE